MPLKIARYLPFLAAVIFGLAANPALPAKLPPAPAPLLSMFHGRPLKPYLDQHGNAIRNVKNSIVGSNWSGYAVAHFETSLNYSSATATWQVPNVTWGETSGSPSQEWNAIWVGIGGFCESSGCSSVDKTLIQIGTMQAVSQSGSPANYVWYELYPAGPVQIPELTAVGDIITASLECMANCTPGATQTWQLSITDQTRGWTWAQDVNFASSMLSADWIVEAPGSPTLPLNNYTQANLDPVVANGANPNLSLTTNSIQMKDPYGQTSNPSTPNNGDWFGTCWGYSSMTPCTAAGFGASAPTASLTASPTSISTGGSSDLTWNSTNASSCSGSGFTASGTSGSAVVYPTATTTYGVTCSGPGGSATVRVKTRGH
jgi:Peptidase A4 family